MYSTSVALLAAFGTIASSASMTCESRGGAILMPPASG